MKTSSSMYAPAIGALALTDAITEVYVKKDSILAKQEAEQAINIIASTTDLTDGVSELATNTLYLVYEA